MDRNSVLKSGLNNFTLKNEDYAKAKLKQNYNLSKLEESIFGHPFKLKRIRSSFCQSSEIEA